jgi:hypothetical protein
MLLHGVEIIQRGEGVSANNGDGTAIKFSDNTMDRYFLSLQASSESNTNRNVVVEGRLHGGISVRVLFPRMSH